MLAMKERKQLLQKDRECLFCGKPKTWRSILKCLDSAMRSFPLFVVTVCPKCRKEHSIQEMYEKAIEKIKEENRRAMQDVL